MNRFRHAWLLVVCLAFGCADMQPIQERASDVSHPRKALVDYRTEFATKWAAIDLSKYPPPATPAYGNDPKLRAVFVESYRGALKYIVESRSLFFLCGTYEHTPEADASMSGMGTAMSTLEPMVERIHR